jgi:flavin-dependent dehydrogenase
MSRTEMFDVVVVGGGPAGATAAHDLALAGRAVLLLDKAGRIKPCGGAIPPRLIRDFAIPDHLLVARAQAARMIAPSERRVWVRHVGGVFEDMHTLGRGVSVGQYGLLFAYAFAALAVGLVRRTRVGRSDHERSSVERGDGPLPVPSGERFSTSSTTP